MDILGRANLDVLLLDAVARAALGAATCGVSVGGGRSRIHLLHHNPPEQQRASDVLSQFGALPLTSSANRVTVGGADPVISCRAALIAEDSALAALILRDGEFFKREQIAVVAGEVSWRLRALTAGTHSIFLYRQTGNYASGALRIQVDPA